MSKVIEKVMFNQVIKFLKTNDILYKKQFGFRRNHSTINAVQLLVSDVLGAFEENMFVAGVFIDLRKAFDSMSHLIILKKLYHIGLHGIVYQWFESYLTNQLQYTCINNVNSEWRMLTCGVPQGALLGVLLFKLEINDMYNCLKFSNSILYADHTTVYIVGRNLRFIRVKLQTDLDAISVWLRANLLKLNVKKTKLLFFGRECLNP